MCKVIVFSNSSKLDIKKTADVLGPKLLSTERDGFGYAVLGSKGQFGEKYVGDAFKSRLGNKRTVVNMPFIKKQHESFGVPTKGVGAAIFHGRTSTNDSGLLNCHPIRRDDWSLIHNGVVNDHGGKYKMVTTNDSEHVLYRLTQGINEVEKHLTGYYAFAAIDPKGVLHIARDTNATLFCAWSDAIESYVFATTVALVAFASDKLKLKVGPIEAIDDDVYFRLSVNKLEHMQMIKPRGYGVRESKLASSSLGRELKGTIEDASETRWSFDPELDEVRSSKYATVYEGYPLDMAYDAVRHELDNLDPSYEVWNSDNRQISVTEFYKLDAIAQELCTIYRYDGSIVGQDEPKEEAI